MSVFKYGNVLTAALAVASAYTSYRYNWLNVGGGASQFMEEWIIADGVIGYLSPAIWLLVLCLIAYTDRRRTLLLGTRLMRIAFTFLLAPAILCSANWFFHIGFPKSPV